MYKTPGSWEKRVREKLNITLDILIYSSDKISGSINNNTVDPFISDILGRSSNCWIYDVVNFEMPLNEVLKIKYGDCTEIIGWSDSEMSDK